MANKYRYIRNIQNRLEKIVLHERADGYVEEVVRTHQEYGEGNTLVRAHVTSTDASGAGVDLSAAPGAGLKASIVSLRISSAATIAIDIVEETSGTVIERFHTVAGSNIHFVPVKPIQLPTAAKKVRIVASGAGALAVELVYFTGA